MSKNKETGEIEVTNSLTDTLREIEIMSKIGDANGSVVKLHEVIDSEKEDKLFLIIDYAQFGEIMSWDFEKLEFETCLENKK